jgi:F0F1-type ATP synthase assembly protein I
MGQSEWRDLSAAWSAIIEFSAAIAVYGVLGWFADRWLGTGHVLFVIGLMLGMVLGVYILAKRATQAAGGPRTPKRSARDED